MSALTNEEILEAIVHRLPWIRRQQDRLRSAERQSAREMVSGESHYVWGSRLRLVIAETEGRPQVQVSGSKLRLLVPREMSTDARRRLLDGWRRKQLKAAVPDLLDIRMDPVCESHLEGDVHEEEQADDRQLAAAK